MIDVKRIPVNLGTDTHERLTLLSKRWRMTKTQVVTNLINWAAEEAEYEQLAKEIGDSYAQLRQHTERYRHYLERLNAWRSISVTGHSQKPAE